MNSKFGNVTIFTVANKPYFSYALTLANSIKTNAPEARFVAHFVNVENELGDRLKTIKETYEPRHETVGDLEPQGKYSGVATYCMRRRIYLFPQLMKEFGGTIIWIDADSILRKPIDSLLECIADYDVAMKQKSDGTYAAGVIAVNCNERSKAFMATYYKIGKRNPHWKADQSALLETAKQYEGKADIKPLPEKYCDVEFTDDGVIWTAKIKCRNNERFQNEWLNYFPAKCY